MEIKQMLLTPNKYSRPQRKLEKITGIVIHYTGNPGSSAIANRNYFESLKEGKKDLKGNYIYASSHLIVGEQGEVIQCIPFDEWSYCSNSRNKDTISIEVCHKDNTGFFNNATRDALIILCKELVAKFGLNPLTDIIRHYDITGKACPLYYVTHTLEWEQLKLEIASLYVDIEIRNKDGAYNREKYPCLFYQNKFYIKLQYINHLFYDDYISVRDICEMLGYNVKYDNKGNIIFITKPGD